MQSPNWKALLELVGAIAIIAGLILVAYELRQGHSIARAELVLESSQLLTGIYSESLDPAFAALIEKSQSNPRELTRVERIQLNAYFDLVVNLYTREFNNYKLGFFENYTYFPRENAAHFFGYGYGKSWWEYRRTTGFHPQLAEVIDEYSQDPERLRYFEMLDQRIVEKLPH